MVLISDSHKVQREQVKACGCHKLMMGRFGVGSRVGVMWQRREMASTSAKSILLVPVTKQSKREVLTLPRPKLNFN